MIETSLSMPHNLFYSDDIAIGVYVNMDLSDYKIRAEIINQLSSSVSLANLAAGGADDQIEFADDGTDGNFIIHIAKNTVNSPVFKSYLEIDLEDAVGHIQTIYYGALNFSSTSFTRECI
jgi:hypothetical protein